MSDEEKGKILEWYREVDAAREKSGFSREAVRAAEEARMESLPGYEVVLGSMEIGGEVRTVVESMKKVSPKKSH